MTTHHKAADQKGPSTSQIVFQPTLCCVSHNAEEEQGGVVAFHCERAMQTPNAISSTERVFSGMQKGQVNQE